MGEDEYLKVWVRRHRKEFARKLIKDSGAEKLGKSAGIFMAGLPGAGKTEFTKSWIANSKLKVVRLDMDEIASQIETYSPRKADKFRKAASALLSRTYDSVVKDGYDFIMDGTFGGQSAIQNIERAVKHGYKIKVIYIYQAPQIAWQYTIAREKVEYRAISLDGFLKSYYKTLRNLGRLEDFSSEQVSIDLVEKDELNKIAKVYYIIPIKDIDNYVNIEYNEESLRKKIEEKQL